MPDLKSSSIRSQKHLIPTGQARVGWSYEFILSARHSLCLNLIYINKFRGGLLYLVFFPSPIVLLSCNSLFTSISFPFSSNYTVFYRWPISKVFKIPYQLFYNVIPNHNIYLSPMDLLSLVYGQIPKGSAISGTLLPL